MNKRSEDSATFATDGGQEKKSAVETDEGNDHEVRITRLFEEHNESLLRFVSARLHSRQEAKEIAQEAYVRLLNLHEPNAVSYLRAYLFRIAANLVSDRLKQRSRRSELRGLVFFDDKEPDQSPELAVCAQDELEIIQKAILELPPKCRKAFLLHKIHGFSIEATAEQMSLSTRMVRLYVARAVAHCRECLDDAEIAGSNE